MADAPAAHASFRHEAWLRAYPLNEATVLDYFAWSPYYDLGCVNEQAKAQGLSAAAAAGLTGTEFALRRTGHERGGLYVIERRHRGGGGGGAADAVPTALYAVVEGTIYPAPDLAAVIAGRCARAAHHVGNALALLEQARAEARAAAAAAAERAAAGGGDEGGSGAALAAPPQPPQLVRQVDAILHGLATGGR